MCGIYGMVAFGGRDLSHPEALERMGRALRHRGPDGHRTIVRRRSAVGAERLRIVDLSERADQPLTDPGARVWMACNGEIYNAGDLRQRFEGYPFSSRVDIETIIPLYLDRGPAGLAELDGMFAVALWDEDKGVLVLARDRAGEKPLFYARAGDEVWFASEVQALLAHPGISRELDDVALAQYLALGYVLEPRTMFRQVRSVSAGTIRRIDGESEKSDRYWDAAAFERRSVDAEAAVADVRALMERAVAKQVAADVPIGVFLSGGLDSSILARLAASNLGAGAVHTFTARFDTPSYDEGRWAAQVAGKLGTHHVEVPVDSERLLEALGVAIGKLAEPLADPALLPTYLLAREARRHVTVVLSGEGADELFGGYPTYLGHKAAPVFCAVPPAARRLLSAAVARVPPSPRKVTIEHLLKRFLVGAERPWLERHQLWFGSGLAAPEGRCVWDGFLPGESASSAREVTGAAMLLDYQTYLRDNLLVKVDRATMLNALEARAPFLDRDLSAFALSVAPELRVRGLSTKWLLKKAARAWLPHDIIHRRKRGFSVPTASLILGALRGEVERLLEPGRLKRQGLLPEPVVAELGALLDDHRAGRANNARPLWTAFILEAWLERWT
jgi:asparagine synthase (glutamine-hydrolysing)